MNTTTVITKSFLDAYIDGIFHTLGDTLIRDPKPIEGEGYTVVAVRGEVTIEDTTYPENSIIKRVFSDGEWKTIKSSEKQKLEGTRYLYVKADGTDLENATELQTAYNTAKTMSPTATNRVVVIAGIGNYNFATDFIMDTEFIDLVSLDGNRSIIFNGTGTINITANDVFVKGVNVNIKAFKIGNDLPLLKLENCQGGDVSFGVLGTASGTFTNCQGGDVSFGGLGTASGTFTNCQGGDASFGGLGTASGTFTNCQGGDYSFGGDGTASGTFTNCQGDTASFGGLGTASGTFTNCTVNGSLKTFQYNTTSIHFKNIPGSQFGESGTPLTGNLTQDLTGANPSQIQKIYHDDTVEPTFPASWKKTGTDIYQVNASAENKVNVIYTEYENTGRQEYWINQTEL